mgnify:CR=1 FL=1
MARREGEKRRREEKEGRREERARRDGEKRRREEKVRRDGEKKRRRGDLENSEPIGLIRGCSPPPSYSHLGEEQAVLSQARRARAEYNNSPGRTIRRRAQRDKMGRPRRAAVYNLRAEKGGKKGGCHLMTLRPPQVPTKKLVLQNDAFRST